MKNKKLFGHILATFTIIIWGTTFIASKTLLAILTPVQIMICRFTIAYAVLWIIHPKWQKPTLKEELRFFLLGLFGCTLYFLAENYALTFTLASNVSILLAFAPILTGIFAHFFTKDEKLHRNVWLGFVLAILGVALVVFNGTVILKLNPKGDILAFLSALMWAIYSVLLKKTPAKYDSFVVARKVSFYGLLTALPYFLATSPRIDFAELAHFRYLGCLLFLGVLGSGICYVSWNIAVTEIGVVKTNNYIYANPFITMVSAGILLDEPITAMAIGGSVLIILGVVLAGKKHKRSAANSS